VTPPPCGEGGGGAGGAFSEKNTAATPIRPLRGRLPHKGEGWFGGALHFEIFSRPPMYGISAFGTVMLPSACW
jgi:hypothetical protein